MNYQNVKYISTKIIFVLILLFSIFNIINAQKLSENKWRVTIQTDRFGPFETVLQFKKHNEKIYGFSNSGSQNVIAKFPKAQKQNAKISKHLFAFSLEKKGEKYEGEIVAPWQDGKITIEQSEKGLKGKIKGGMFNGNFDGVAFEDKKESLRDYSKIVDSFLQKVEAKIFNPRVLQEPAWKEFTRKMKKVGESAKDDCDVLLGFHFAYEGKPFSHLTFGRARASANQMMAYLDTMRVGGKPAWVDFDGDLAILNVKTMMGVDTIEMIEKSYKEIAQKSPKALIIDLRGNGGGAFAIKPLIEHIIDKPMVAGYFITHNWNTKNKRLPTKKELSKIKPWEGFSLKAWWENVQAEKIIKLEFKPQEPNFDGPVYVLFDSRSASATEMAIDALSTAKNVTLIGEKTSGDVLSQSPFDTSDGFQAFIPVGDYYSFTNGRIEGVGIKPNIEAKSADALKVAKQMALSKK